MERRLAAILSADVVGYSRLMSDDEAGTLARLEGLKAEILDPLIDQHSGRVVKLMGDGFLVEFGSVVDALECAVAWQKTVEARARQTSDDRAIRFRIGINIGDVIVKGEDVYGDGVNVAARLEGLAEPGEILVSRTVANHVKGKIGSGFQDLGEQELKNIPEPVQVFRVVAQSGAEGATAAVSKKTGLPKVPLIAAGLAVLILAAGAALWLKPWEPRIESASVERMAFPLPDRPSIAVLPFRNMSDDPEQEHFADGMTDDLITDLSKISGLFVIARNSTFVYKNQPAEIRKVAEALGVRYVVEGSVRRAGDTVRVNAQLIDAITGGHIWAERYDGKVADIFGVQDDFVRKIVEALEINLAPQEAQQIGQGQTNQIAARDAFQKGWELYLRFNAEDNAKAIPHLETAVELDPEYGRAYAALALVYSTGARFPWALPTGLNWMELRRVTAATLKQAKQYPTALVHVVAALDDLYFGRVDQARTEASQAIAMQPNDPEAHIAMAWMMIASGNPLEGLNFVQAAMRLNPSYPSHYVLARGTALYANGNLEEAARTFEDGIERDPKAIELLPLAASIFAQLGRRQEAREVVLKWRPGVGQLLLQSVPDGYELPVRWEDEHRKVRERLVDGLRVAVLPLDTTVSSLVGRLKLGTPFGRAGVAQTLGWFGPAAAAVVPDLIEALGDEHEEVREQAAIALGKIGPAAKGAIPALQALQEEALQEEAPIGHYAKEAIRRITGD